MPAKRKRTESKKAAAGKTPMRKTAKRKLTGKKKPAGKKVAKKAPAARRTRGKKKTAAKTVAITIKQVRKRNRTIRRTFSLEGDADLSGRQSGDLQGLSRDERADSQSLDELLEEGNAFEAAAVKGVEDAEDADEGEVRTHEVLEDDVPDEYLDKE